MTKEIEKICRLCGRNIEKVKGVSQKVFEQELREGVHQKCLFIYRIIMQEHKISDREYLNALSEALLHRFPSLKREPSLVEYDKRVKSATEAVYKAFPYVKEMVEKDEKEEVKEEEEGDVDKKED